MSLDVVLSAQAAVAVELATQGPLDVELLPDHRLGQHVDFDDSNIVTGNVVTRQADGTFAMEGVPGGISAFLGLSDTPASYASQTLKVVRVNAGETALEFVTLAGGGDMTAAVYDPAAITEQLVGLTAVQTITGKSIVATQIDSGTLPDARIQITGVTQHQASIDHDALLNFAAGEHFTEASIDHVNILNIGTNSHAAIDSHIAATAAHGATGAVVGTTNVQTLTNKTLDDFTNDVHADNVHEELRNESGGAMTMGDAVFISGYSVGLNIALVTLADASAAGTMPCVAILDEATLANNATGQFVEVGRVIDMDTSAWAVGDEIWVSETGTTGNTLTNVKPTGTALIQKVAVVLRSHATLGILEVFGAGRTNDLPNIPTDNLWVGNGSAVPTATGSTGTGLIVRQGSPTITTPTIASFANATHDHSNAAGGGTIAIADTTGTLLEGRGGTAQTTYATGDILYASGADTLAKLAIGSGADVLTVSGGVPIWSPPGGGSAHNLLSATHTDTGANAPLRGSLVIGTTATPVWNRVVLGASGTYLRSDGTDALWAALDLTDAAQVSGFTGTTPSSIVLSASPTIVTPVIASFASAQHDHSGAAGGGTIAIADTTGTLLEARGGTGESTYTQGDLLYSDAANSLAKLAKGTTHQHLRMSATIPQWYDKEEGFRFALEDPVAGDLLFIDVTNKPITVTEIQAICDDGTSVVLNVRQHTSIVAAGGTLVDQITPTTAVTSETTISSAAVPADRVIFIEVGTVTGGVTSVGGKVYYTED